MLHFLINTAQAVSLPSFSSSKDLPSFISSVYSFSLTIVGVVIFVQILRAGFLMLTAAGNTSKEGQGREMIKNAVVGAILLFAAYLILYVINPDLVKNTFNFSLPKQQSGQAPATPPLPLKTDPTPGTGAAAGVPGSAGTGSLSYPVAHAQEGVYAFTIEVVDADGNKCDKAFNLEIGPNLAPYSQNPQRPFAMKLSVPVVHAQDDCGAVHIGTQTLPNGVEGVPYFAEIIATGGRLPYVYSVVEESGGLPPGLSMQATLEMPILTIENKTAKRDPSYAFSQTDTFRLELTNAKPSSTVFFKWQKDGAPWFYPGRTPNKDGWIDFAKTDADGKWVNEAPFTADQVGSWYEWAMVDGKVSKAIGFQVVAPKVKIETSSSVAPPPAVANYGGISSCTPEYFCENTKTGERSSVLTDEEAQKNANDCKSGALPPDSISCENPNDRCPGGRRAGECVYPEQNLSNICDNFQFEWRNCLDNYNAITKSDGTLDTSNLVKVGDGAPPKDVPAGSLWASNQYWVVAPAGAPAYQTKVGDNTLVTCRYSDQSAAVKCGLPRSGDICLPFGTVTTNSKWCANVGAGLGQ